MALVIASPLPCAALPHPQTRTTIEGLRVAGRDAPVDLALFVRDRYGHAVDIAMPLIPALVGEGVRPCLVSGGSDLPPRWTDDDARAAASGAPYWVRVDIRRWREVRDVAHRETHVWRPAAGFVIGLSDVIRIGEPEIDPALLERVEIDRAQSRRELRVDVTASVRRTGTETPIARWSIAEGALRMEPLNESDEIDPRLSPLLYEELAKEIAQRIAQAIRTGQ